MKKYLFQIQALIEVEQEGQDADDARRIVIDNLDCYYERIYNDCYVSNGDEIK